MAVRRKYTVEEIDHMRLSLVMVLGWGGGRDVTQRVEDQLRTHLVAGTDPAELRAACEVKYKAALKVDEAAHERRMAEHKARMAAGSANREAAPATVAAPSWWDRLLGRAA